MNISAQEFQSYDENGFLLKQSYFSPVEIKVLQSQLTACFAEGSPRRILEKDGRVRSVYGVHSNNEVFKVLVQHPKLLGLAMKILGGEVYVYQFKINAKLAMGGDVWEWHQDYIFWKKEDGLPRPDILSLGIFLDEVTEFNGPLMFIPGSHRHGLIQADDSSRLDESQGEPQWTTDLTADLKYSLGREQLAGLLQNTSIAAPKGPEGSLLIFSSTIVHGSATNMSPFDRRMILVTYSKTDNQPSKLDKPRPDFLVARNMTALTLLSEDCLENFVER